MLHAKIIIGIGVLIGLLVFNKTKPDFLKVILIGLSICYGLGYFVEFPIGTVAFMLFGILALIFAIYCGKNNKWIGFIIGILTFLSYVWIFMSYPYANELKLMMLIPIICYAWTLKKYRNYAEEFSILTILVSYEISEFLILIGTWIK